MQSDFSESTTRLAEIFERHLDLSDPPSVENGPTRELNTFQKPHQDQGPPQVSITQHYHHSAHIIGGSLHPLQPHREDETLRQLIQNDIAPSSLLRSQLELFERSTTDERAKLILLWRLAPPTYARNGGQELADRLGEYQTISVEQEEQLAWLRYQHNHARRDVKTDTLAEQLCGRQTLLGHYFDQDLSVLKSVPSKYSDPQETGIQASIEQDEDMS